VHYAGALEAEGEVARGRGVWLAHAATLNGASSITVSQMLWTRALPGTVAVLAALSLPELSLGAGAPEEPQASLAQTRVPVLAAARPVEMPPKLGLLAAEPAPAGLRSPLPPVAENPVSAPDPVVAAAAVVPVPEARPASLAGLVTERVAEIAAPARMTVPPAQLESLALAVPATAPVNEPAPPAAAPEMAAETALASVPKTESRDASPKAGAATARAFGGAKGSFGGLAPSAVTAPDAALAAESVAIPAPAGVRDAVPGRRPALAPEAAPAPAPAPRAMAPATNIAPSGTSDRIAAATPLARPAAPLAVAAPVAAAAPAPVRSGSAAPVAAPRVAAPAAPSAPVRAAAPAFAAPRPKPATPPAAAPAPARAAAPAAPAPAAALVPLPQTKPQQAAPGARQPGAYQIDVKSQLITRVDGKMAGQVDFRQTSAGLQVRLGSIVELLGDRYDPAQIARIKASSASELYLPLAQLQAQGIPISYDPVYDEFNVGLVDTRPKAARKVHMDQISAPERGLGSTGIDQVRR
jgi:Meckel syndrome type 1 protein